MNAAIIEGNVKIDDAKIIGTTVPGQALSGKVLFIDAPLIFCECVIGMRLSAACRHTVYANNAITKRTIRILEITLYAICFSEIIV